MNKKNCTLETSFFIIKPHGLVFIEEVRVMIEDNGTVFNNTP